MPGTTTAPDVMVAAPAAKPRPPLDFGMLLGFALAVLLVHVLVNVFGPYGFHRDEFLYFAMGRHLQLWAMDFPPLIALISEGIRQLLGDSLVGIRLVPALAQALLVMLAGVAAREFGGGRFAQALAALSVALAPLFLRAGNLFQPVVLDQLWWTLALLALARIGRTADEPGGANGDPIAWLALGVIGGVGLLTKFSIVFLALAMVLGLLISPQRRLLRSHWPWEAAFLGLLIGSPSIIGQIQLGFPVVAQMRDLQLGQLRHVGYLDFLFSQLWMFGPILLLPLLGIARLLAVPAARGHRAVAWSCLVAFALLLVLHGKGYYIGPIYPVLIGAGAAALELGTGAVAGSVLGGRVTSQIVRWAVVALIVVFGGAAIPMGLPVLSPAPMARYAAALSLVPVTRANWGERLQLPQDYADMIGWPEEVAAVARVYNGLPQEQRQRAVVIGSSYGHAGAIDFFGPKLGLPPAISPAGSYWFFGPGTRPGEVAVVLGSDSATLARHFHVVHLAARMNNPWGVPEERHVGIFVAQQPTQPLQQLWPSLARRN